VASDVSEQEAREHLEAERDFLLRSLDDLEAEREAGGIDRESYARLHDDYTARAAAAIRALRDGIDARPVAAPLPWGRRLLVGGAIGAFALVAAVALAAALGARLPGQTSSGNTGSDSRSNTAAESSDRRAALERTVEENPDDIGARIALARFLEADRDLAAALLQYDEVTERDPANAEALAQGGRILYLTAEQVVPGSPQAVDLVNEARARLDAAVAADPEHADARYFRAVLLAEERFDDDQAIADAQRYLVLAPDGPFADQSREILALLGADAPAGSPPPAT
jgi:cytochrome c-type biogenesis protein CcmH/NrfG